MPKLPPPFKLASIDDLLSPEECARWMRFKSFREFDKKVRKKEIPSRRFGHKTRRFWPREILEAGGGKMPQSCDRRPANVT